MTPACGTCDGTGFVPVPGENAVRPCSECRQRRAEFKLKAPKKAKAPKRVRDTSIESLAIERRADAVRDEPRRQQVRRLTRELTDALGEAPTSYEVLVFGQKKGENLRDVNSVRPTLTNMADDNLAEVVGSRKCRITGRRARTWRILGND